MKYRKKWPQFSAVAIAILLTLGNVKAQKLQLLRKTQLRKYPSASAIEWHKGRLYLMGDDAPGLLGLNKKHKKPRAVKVFKSDAYRIPWQEKPDIESGTVFRWGTNERLLFFASFSAPGRNELVIINSDHRTDPVVTVHELSLPEISGIKEINIEGATQVQEGLLLSNRGNLSAPQNHLLLTHLDTASGLKLLQKVLPLQLPKTEYFAGVSGLYYLSEKDLLLFTASIEMTTSATADGAIGDSFIGIVRNLKVQLQHGQVVADTLINLTPVLRSTTPQKIESITAEKVGKKSLVLHLAADNDNGESTLFRIRMKGYEQQHF